MSDPLVGSIVGGYRIIDLVGRGGMGVVYEAVELALDRVVALKVIAPELAGDPVFRDRFMTESRLAASIEHPAALPIYRAAEADGVLFLAMRLIRGEDLATVVRDRGPMEPARAAGIVAQVAGALDAAHARRLIHRDVKPANMLLDGDDRGYLTDFGLAKVLGPLAGHTRSGIAVGTLDYLAPEQIQGASIGPWTDTYALGCALFFLLTGRVVFPVETPEQKLWAHVTDAPPVASALRPEVPHELDVVLQRALAKSPDERWPSAGELAAAAVKAAEGAAEHRDRRGGPPRSRVPRRISSARMIGRTEYLAALDRAMSRAAAGEPQWVLLAGDGGIGKTRLAREFAARAGSAEHRVLWGECVPSQAGELPYAPIAGALRELYAADALGGAGRELAQLLPALREAGSRAIAPEPGAQARLFELLLDLLGRLAQEAPIVFVIEDLHWADRATQDVLRFLARNVVDQRLLVVLTQRTDEAAVSASLATLLVELGRSDRMHRIELAPLTREETARQLAGIGNPEPALVERVYALSEGNPYFAEELLASSAGATPNAALPTALRDVLRLRLAGLSAPARTLLRIAATAGRDVEGDVLQRAAALDDDALGAALHELMDAYVLVSDAAGERFAFRHALAREGVYRDLLAHERRAYHRVLAEAMEAATPEGERGVSEWAALARHWDDADKRAAALRATIAAARSAADVYAFGAARGHLDRARTLWHRVPLAERPRDLDEPELLRRVADTMRLDGDWSAAIPVAESALALVDPASEPQSAADLHELLGRLHRSPQSSISEFERALELLPESPSAQRASLMLEISRKQQYGQMPSTVLEPTLEALEVARAADAVAEQGGAHEQLGKAYSYAGDPDRGIGHYREAIRVGAELQRGEDMATAMTNLGATLIMLGRVEEAFGELQRALEDVRRVGLASSYGTLIEAHLADCEMRLGQWTAGRRRLDRVLDGPLRDDDVRLRLIGLRLALDGREGRHDSSESERMASALIDAERWPQTVVIANSARAEIALLRGDPDAAATIVAQTRNALFCGDLLWWPAMLTLGLRAEADRAVRARAEGRDDLVAQSRAGADWLLGSIDVQGSLRWARFEQPVAEAAPPETLAHLSQGAAELTRLDGTPRPDLWAGVVSRWDALGFPYQSSYARLREAESLLAAGGGRDAAATALTRAQQALRRLGAAPLLGEVEALAVRAPSGPAAARSRARGRSGSGTCPRAARGPR